MDVEVSELVDEMIVQALQLGVSDIHFNPAAEGVRVYFRLHGKVVPVNLVSSFSHVIARPSVQRLKVLAKLSLSEQRRPQDGQFRLQTPFGPCDLRVSTMPTVRGERAVVRILPAAVPWQSLASLGLPPRGEDQVRRFFVGAGGLLVVAGKVGAGKSTTIHALLFERSLAGDSVLTIEDPVERKIESFQQVEVDERIGLSFAEGLRTALRQDPDLLMVGEIRDEVTAQIAVRAGLTGHHILTTMHADNPEQVAFRLLEFGIAKAYLSQALKLVLWQRLQAIPCANCRGEGCEACRGVGVVGRRPEFTVMTNREIAELLRGEERPGEEARQTGRRANPYLHLRKAHPFQLTGYEKKGRDPIVAEGGETETARRGIPAFRSE